MGEASRRATRFLAILFGVGAFLWFRPPDALAAPHNVSGWAWSGNTGWIVVNCNDAPDGCAGPGGDYGLDIDDSGNLAGWAWSVNAGWICFGSSCVGAPGVPAATPANDDYCIGNIPCARYDTYPDNPVGQLHGWAYVVSMTDGPNEKGWISLNCTDLDPVPPRNYISDPATGARTCDNDYAVEYDEGATPTEGLFRGYAWNGNSDQTGNGWIQFACGPTRPCAPPDWGVAGTYVTSGWDSLDQPQGVYSPAPPPATGTHLTTIPLVFRNFSAPAGSSLECSFRMADGNYRLVNWPIAGRISRAETYSQSYAITGSDSVSDPSGNPVLWSYSSVGGWGCQIGGGPQYQRSIANTVAVHPSTWTFTGAGGPLTSDANRAKYCLDGNVGSDPARAYFLNAVQCDTEGDLALTLLKARGVRVEVICSDDVDDDSNLQKDCLGGGGLVPERACRGITYLCISHPPAPSTEPPRP